MNDTAGSEREAANFNKLNEILEANAKIQDNEPLTLTEVHNN